MELILVGALCLVPIVLLGTVLLLLVVMRMVKANQAQPLAEHTNERTEGDQNG
jgi:hypothetical protein